MKNLLLALSFVLLSISYSSAADVVLTWDKPTQNADNSVLTDLGGYKVFVGTASNTYGAPINVPDPNKVSFTVSNLPDGTYYFNIKSYDTGGRESGYATECSLTIDTVAPNPPGNFNCGF